MLKTQLVAGLDLLASVRYGISDTCLSCGSSNPPTDFDDSTGRLIVSENLFWETSSGGGAARVQGSYVAEGQTHAGGGGGGRFRSGNSFESREQVIQNGRCKIVQLAGAINCPEHFADHAQRWFTLSVTYNFNRGRKTQFVVACCLYIVCRFEKIGVNVFSLGHTCLRPVQILEVRLPHIDPTVCVYRFAKHLDFGGEQTKVANDALRIIQRRRPSGICGATLVLAARMNNFHRSVREVVYKRLDEFKDTKSGDLTVEEFRNIWLEQAHDPPSYGPKALKRRKRVRGVNDGGEVIEDPQDITIVAAPADPSAAPSAPPALLLVSIPAPPRFCNPRTPCPFATPDFLTLPGSIDITDPATPQSIEKAQEVIESEIASLLDGSAASIMGELQEADRQAREKCAVSTISDDPHNLDDVDDDFEVQSALLTEEERDLKEKIWLITREEGLSQYTFSCGLHLFKATCTNKNIL
ncbi:hypothetical protein B9Z19DRAFT_1103203 [Tuber borchii]|uniref:Transcription factor TFIIB cyclin-like domain-containing protein n=1 Tax=Tuber borchii TaxID=42251 RepID=A0A2T6ZHK0_TUBBO|nr:hypothetical protein B9Z19DRAFT_1103203 [Tuber borchii]